MTLKKKKRVYDEILALFPVCYLKIVQLKMVDGVEHGQSNLQNGMNSERPRFVGYLSALLKRFNRQNKVTV